MIRLLPGLPCLARAPLALFSPPSIAVLTLAPHIRPSRKMNTSAAAAAAEGDVPRPIYTASGGGDGEVADTLVQYVVVRRDLVDTWTLGSVVAQGCHAAVAAVWSHRDHPDTAAYLSPAALDSMHKVTLEVKGETQLKILAEKLRAEGIDHKLWIEQPEDIPTCIATRPYHRSEVASYFKKLKLCK